MALSGLRQGPRYLKPSSGKSYTKYISWKDGDAKTIAFLTPAEEFAKVRLHNFVKVEDDSERGWHWDTFMCRKDPAWLDESGGKCELCDLVGHPAREQHVALALELNPVTAPNSPKVTGLEVQTVTRQKDDGTEVEYPQWGLVIQSFRNFFSFFTAFAAKYGDVTETAFDITRDGNDKDTIYPVIPLMDVDLPDLKEVRNQVPTLLEVLESMGSREKYDRDLPGAQAVEQPSYEDESNGQVDLENVETEFSKLRASLSNAKTLEEKTPA